MKVHAQAKYIRQSPYKVRRVLDLVRGLPVEDARDVLTFTNRRAADTIRKVLDSAVANAEHNYALDADELFVDRGLRRRGTDAQALAAAGPRSGHPHQQAHEPHHDRRRRRRRGARVMGQKIHPYGLRLGIVTDWKSRWYSEKDYAFQVNEDAAIRKYLFGELTRGAISRIDIERIGDKKVQIDVHTARPGVVIGRSGSEAERLRSGLEKLTKRVVKFNVIEVQNPETDATLLAAASPTSSKAVSRSAVP